MTVERQAVADFLNGGEWSSVQVMRILERLDPFPEGEAAAA